jgi:uncharacterized protein
LACPTVASLEVATVATPVVQEFVSAMHTIGKEIHFSASDLVGHLNCRYLTTLDLAAATGALAKPKVWDPVLEVF